MAQPASRIVDVGSADAKAFVARNKQRPFMRFATLSFYTRELRLRSVSGSAWNVRGGRASEKRLMQLDA
jgi:hypothetical protein